MTTYYIRTPALQFLTLFFMRTSEVEAFVRGSTYPQLRGLRFTHTSLNGTACQLLAAFPVESIAMSMLKNSLLFKTNTERSALIWPHLRSLTCSSYFSERCREIVVGRAAAGAPLLLLRVISGTVPLKDIQWLMEHNVGLEECSYSDLHLPFER